ncbi:hypothetical protein [Halonotius pteroides]|nr:hypothetical protein [Halonotius pteroides]
MSLQPADDDTETGSEEDDPVIPAGVLRGIEDIADENTASKADLESILES